MILADFLIRAALAGVGVALAAGPLGCFVLWRRLAYFGDATAHASILGVAFALALSMPVALGSLLAALALGLGVVLGGRQDQHSDTTLGVISYSALALGLVTASLLGGNRIDLTAYLFGDILAVGQPDLITIWLGAVAVLALLAWRWEGLLLSTLNPDLAAASGLNPRRESLILTLALALVVAVAIKVVGALLIGAMLILPAAAARSFARTPEAMAALAAGIGAVSALGGLVASFWLDTPAGPSIVTASTVIYVVSRLVVSVRPARG